jgi:hypothetical protein
MKYLLALIASTMLSMPVYADDETKKVCKDKMSQGKPVKKADGTVVQECKTIKTHKKLEGHQVPDKSKK